MPAFDDADPTDGEIEVGVTTAAGPAQWAARSAGSRSDGRRSPPYVRMTHGRAFCRQAGLAAAVELDGGARSEAKKSTVQVTPAAITVRVPR